MEAEGFKINKTKIDWCDCTVNPVMGCPNGCGYCYARKLNARFKWIEKWSEPQFFPERLKEFQSKTPKSIFIDSMSDIGTWEQEWLNAVLEAINNNPQHKYIALTKRLFGFKEKLDRANCGVVSNLWVGTSITNQKQMDMLNTAFCNLQIDFFSIEPILEPITLKVAPKTIIIGAETGNRKGKIIPQKEWIDSLVKQAGENRVIFMKESLREIMGDDFRQDRLPWEACNGKA